MRTRAVASAVLVCLSVACSPPAMTDASLLRVSLPLGLETTELRQLTVTQLGEVQQLELPAGGSATARVLAGVPVDVTVTVLGVEAPSAFRVYTASRQLVPAAGATALDLELEASEDRAGSAVPAFVVAGVAHPFDTTVTITDVETGHQLTGFVPRTGEAFALPAGRLVELAAASPTDPGGTAAITLSGSDFAADTPIPLTAPTTELSRLRLAAGTPTDVNAAIAGLPLALSCTGDPTCPPGATYSATLPLVPALERTYALGCRYAGTPDLCVPLEVVVDATAPVLELSATPPYLPPAGASVTLAIHAAEPLDPAMLEVTVGGATACTPSWAGAADATCVVPAALLAADPTDVTVTAADASGNAASSVLRLRGVVDGSGLAITAVRTFPPRPAPTDSFLVGFDVVGLQPCVGSVPVLLQGLATDNPPAGPVIAAASVAIDPALLPITQPPTTVDLSADTAGAPARLTLWASVTGGSTLLPGTYGMALSTDGSCGVDSATFDVPLVPPPPRWITSNGVLTLAERTGSDFVPPVGPGSSFGWLTSDPAVVAIQTANGAPLGPQVVAPGRAVVTVTASPTDSTPVTAAIFDIAPGPALALLQDDGAQPVPRGWVLVADASSSERIDLDPAIGTPQRLLWDPGRDALVAVGTLGIEDLGTSPPAVLAGLPTPALDAALVPDAAGGPGSVVLLLEKALVVMTDLATGVVAAPAALDTTGCTALPTRLTYGPVGGELTALGGDCPRALRFESGVWRERPLRLAAANPSGAASDARSDLVVLVDGKKAAWSVLTAGTGSSTAAYVDPRSGQLPAAVDAIAVDGASGRPVLAAYDATLGTSILTCSRTDPNGCLQFESSLKDPVAALVVDATSREVIAISPGAIPPLVPLSFYSGMPVPLRVVTPALDARPVTDAVLRGPQVLSFSPHSVAPGGLVTIVGTGFSAGGRDEVFVQGVRAETLASTPTFVVARVPPALAAWRAASPAVLGVRSHGRLVQTAALLSLVTEPATLEATPDTTALCTTTPCPSSYEQPSALVTENGTQLVSYPSSGLFDTWLYPVLSVPSSSPVVMSDPIVLGASRVVGRFDELDPTNGALTGRSWVEYRPDGAESRSVPIDQGATFASVGPLAADPTERLLAMVADDAIHLYRAATYAEAAAPAKLASGNVGLAFTRDGGALVALGTTLVPGYDALQLAAVALDVSGDLMPATAPPRIPVGFDAACPTTFVSSPRLLSFSGSTPESMLAVYDSSGTMGGPNTLVFATLAAGTVTVQGVPWEGLVFSCTPTAVASSGIATAAVSGGGRLLAVGMNDQLVLLSPAAPRVTGLTTFGTLLWSLAFAPEPPTGPGTLVTALGGQSVEIDTLLTR